MLSAWFGFFLGLFDWCKVTESVPKERYSGAFFYQQDFNREINRWGIKQAPAPLCIWGQVLVMVYAVDEQLVYF